jgi:hypothetical protein
MVGKIIVQQYLDAGKKLTLLNGKRPILPDWVKTKVDKNKLLSHKGNLGWVLGKNDLVIDVDPKNGGLDSYNKLFIDKLDMMLVATVVTPSSGTHSYFKIPNNYQKKKFHKTLKEYPGIDFLTYGSQCVIPGSETDKGKYEWADDIFGEFEQDDVPKEIIDLISYNVEEDDLGDFEGLIDDNVNNWSEEDVIRMIDKLDPSMGNSEWVKVGMALHNWDKKKGLKVWEEWSKEGENYEEGETAARWRSFKPGKITLGTLSYMAKEVDYCEESERISSYLYSIDGADEMKLEFDIIPKIRKEEFNDLNKEKIVKAIQVRYKQLSDVRMPVGSIRASISNQEIVSGNFINDEDIPEWCNNWIYINSHNGFMNLKTLKLHKSESFNVENGKNIPSGLSGLKQSASKFVSDHGFIKKVETISYLPTLEPGICDINGYSVLNSFNPKSIPIEATEYTEEGLEAIERIKRHIKLIFGNDENCQLFTEWLAHNIQFPGKQLLYAPVIQSIEGTGKSFFGQLLRGCLGDSNVGVISPNQITSNFNGWATGVCINILEEICVTGHNRYDAINALKPLITDTMIQINDKGVNQYMTRNTANYIGFTNRRDAIPIGENDRRWWVIWADINSLKDLPKLVNESVEIYFPKLFDTLNYNREIRKWLLEYPISKKFLNTKQAPLTDNKLQMISNEELGLEGLTEVRQLIEKGGRFYDENVVSSSDLFDDLMMEYPDIEVTVRSKNTILKRLNFSYSSKLIKIDGEVKRIWTKEIMDNDEIREYLTKKDD